MRYALAVLAPVVFSSALLPAHAFWDFGGWESKYNELLAENEELKNEISDLKSEILRITELYEASLGDIMALKSEVSSLKAENSRLSEQNRDYHEERKVLLQSNDDRAHAYDELVDEYDAVYEAYDHQIRDYNELVDEYNQFVTEPRLEIDKTNIIWDFQDSKGNSYGITWPVKYYEDLKSHSEWKSLSSQPVRLDNHGRTIYSINLDGFVLGDAVSCCIDQVYDNSLSNSDFVYEVWYIASQLTVYDADVDEKSEGRYALETIVRGGGDCEDLVILVAELLKSSKHTRNWDFQYVYMDADNPTNPQTVNHVILLVNDGTYDYLIEATAEPRWDYFPNGVNGWFFDV